MTTPKPEPVAAYVARLKALIKVNQAGGSRRFAISIDKLLALIASWEAQQERIRALEEALQGWSLSDGSPT